jgi:HSP20 family protein
MFRPTILNHNFTDNLFDDFFDDSFWMTPGLQAGNMSNAMKTDIQEKNDSYQIDMELPGFSKEEVQAELNDGYLTIHAEHQENHDQKKDKEHYLCRERFYGNYQRSFYVGDAVTEQDIKAKFSDGILQLTIPKKENKPKVEDKKLIAIEG